MAYFRIGINDNVNNSRLNISKNKQNTSFSANSDIKNQQEIKELPDIPNYSTVKTPLGYAKICEKDLPYGLKAHFYKLSNGQQVVIIPKEGKTVLRSYVNTGSMNETDNIRGISHYIEHNLFNGSEGLEAGAFSQIANKIGAETNASTGLAETNYYISSNLLNDTDLEEEIKIHASMLESPKFATDMLEKEKGIVNSEINMITSNAENLAYQKTIKNLFNIDTKSDDIIGGTTDNITNLTREDVVNYFDKNYYPANIVTVITGEVEPDETVQLLAKHFHSTKTPPEYRHFEKLEPLEKTKREDIISNKTQSAFVTLGFEGPKNNDLKSEIEAIALSKLMFSTGDAQKIFKQMNTRVEFNLEKILSSKTSPKAYILMAESSEENSEKVLKTIYNRIQEFQNKKISEDELNIIKKEMKKFYNDTFESSFAINNLIGTNLLEGRFDDIGNYTKLIDNMTVEDIQNTAIRLCNLNKAAVTVIHPENTDKKQILENYNNNKSINFTGSNKKHAFDINKVKQYELQNNYRVSLYKSNFPNIHADVAIRPNKPIYAKNPAAYIILNDILENGTNIHTKEEFTKLQEKYGIGLAMTTDENGIYSYYSADKEDFDKAHELYKELLENPRFTQEAFNEACERTKDYVSRIEKSPFEKLDKTLYPKTGFQKEDILKGLETLTLEDVSHLYKEILNNSQALTSVAAPLGDDNQMRDKILSSFSEFAPAKKYTKIQTNEYEPVSKTEVLTDTDNKSQARILMAYKFKYGYNIKDQASLMLLNKILGGGSSSRLFEDLREKQKLAYTVRSSISNKNDSGHIILSIGTTTDNRKTGEQSFDNLQKSINGFQKHIKEITNNKVSDEELSRAKLTIKNEILSNNENTSSKNSSIIAGQHSWYGIDYENKLLETIDTITAEDILNAAKFVFKGHPVYSILTTQDTLNHNKEYLENLGR